MYPLIYFLINIIWRISGEKNIFLFTLLSKLLLLCVYIILFLPLCIVYNIHSLFMKKPTDSYFDSNESAFDANSFDDKF
jgi:hypothetical protein